MSDLTTLLRSGLEQFEPPLPVEPPLEPLLGYVAELAQWNRAYNLTAVRDPAEMVDRHLLDSLAIAPFVRGNRLLDVGAGAGLPGIPLAIVQPERHFTLLDSNGKKVRFMAHAVRTLGLRNVEVVQSRIEQFRPDTLPDAICARAFAPVAQLLGVVEHLCRPGTQILAMRGRDEPYILPPTFKQLENRAIKVPRSPAPRHLLILEYIE